MFISVTVPLNAMFFYPIIFLTFGEIVFLPLYSYPEPSYPRGLIEDGPETVAGVCTSSSSPAFALILYIDFDYSLFAFNFPTTES